MRYMLLIYNAEADGAKMTPEESQANFGGWMSYTQELRGRRCCPASRCSRPRRLSATTVRVRDGKTLSTDGPFAETKEQLGGFYILECKDLDEAIEWAAKMPSAPNGSVEIRPVMEFDH